ncbi:glycosyltransferase family 2 protein [Fredinandcohnia onubensis]|uniref:glycosyltransferase family 2 protein n=1 Tax=Fredinandcohnia onubensis TaxID=1571209 RepID=UPI0015D4D373|nr:glycosyltransferase family A protein [Fredinandcohnia onubensis]
MESPLVTVFIPVYNSEEYLEEALKSIINQTYQNLEILIVDDGSTDQSVSIINSINDSRIHVISNDGNKGIPYSRNVGLEHAKGKYMAIMDADDIALPNRIERQVQFMEKNKEIDAIGTFYELFGGRLTRTFKPKYITSDEIKAQLLFFSQIGNPTAMIRLGTLKKHKITYNLSYFVAQDYDMWVQISKVGNLHILPEVLLKYRTGHSNITKKSQQEKATKRKKIIDSIHKDILTYYKMDFTDEEMEVYNDFFNDTSSEVDQHSLLQIPNVVIKMIDQNKKNKLFKEEMLKTIIHDAVFFTINNHKLSLPTRLNTFSKLNKAINVKATPKEIGYIIAKHLYRKIR